MATLFKDVLMLDGGRKQAVRGHLLVSKGRIVSILGLEERLPGADKIVSGHGRMAVLPGFVNAHTHAAMVLLRGLGEEAPLMEWLEKNIWPVEAKLTSDFIYWGTASAVLEMLAGGTTCFADMYFEMDRVAEVALQARMRAALCRGIVAGEAGKLDRSLQEGLDLAEHWHGREGLITVQLGPHAPYTVPLDDMRRIFQAAREHNLGVHLHFLETEWELNYLRQELKREPADYLRDVGLQDAPQTVLAHAVWLDPATEVDLSRVTLVHCPGSNLKLGSGVMPLAAWLEKGTPVALGTDGASSNNRLDMWEEMRTVALLHKGVNHDPMCVPALDALRMVTYEGARAFGFAQKGMIREGWMADLVLVDLDRPHYVGANEENLAAYIVYAGSAADIVGTMVNGKWSFRNGEFPTLDREEIVERAREAREAITR
ncbi:amidohydrolase [Fretibacterium fastidiosum]|uniref:amidohydrolase n=1 Tax=Fretibacterium fastidiosum TaxID=651822 RepID=UPI00031C44A2|nr:amidohydrolase [Fretibacterium fastidiosum]